MRTRAGARRAIADRHQLLERDTEIAILSDLLDSARTGEGGLAFVEGHAGIGKSSLLREALAEAREHGFETANARASELERDFAFGVVRQLLEPKLSGLPSDQRAQLFAGAAGLAAPLFESVGVDGPTPGAGASHSVVHGLYWLTVNLATTRPLILAVDDAHWADAPSLRFLAHLVNRVAELPVFMVVAARPMEPGAEVELLEHLVANPSTHVIRPSLLSAEAVEALVKSTFAENGDHAFASACFEASGGNPLLLRELLATLHAEGVSPRTSDAASVLEAAPKSVARSVGRRLRRLAPEAEVLAGSVAVLGAGADLGVAATLAGLDQDAAAGLVDALGRAEILGESCEFVHPVVRTAIYSELSPAERARQHRAAASLLAEAGAPEDEVALHLLAGQPSGDAWATGVLRRSAGRARARGAPEVAVTHLKRAAAEPPRVDERADVLLELGLAEMAAGEPSGIASLRDAVGLCENPHDRARVGLELGKSLLATANFSEAVEAFERALADLGEADLELKERIQGHLISACMPIPALRPRVLGLIGPLMLDSSGVSAPVVLAVVAAAMCGSIQPAQAAADVAERALASGLPSPEDGPLVLGYAAGTLLAADRLERAKEVWDRASDEARQRGSIPDALTAANFRASVDLRLGNLSQAEADARHALENTHEDVVLVLPLILTSLIGVLIEKGELDEGERLLEEHQLAGELPDLLIANPLLEVRGRLRVAQGRVHEGIADLRECGGRFQTWFVSNPGIVPWRTSLALALTVSGERDEALALAREGVELAQAFAVPRELGMALRAVGLIEGGEGGIERLQESVSVLEGTPAKLELARALTDLGAALRRIGRRSAAREPLRAGLDLARRCAATALVERAHKELVATGARPRTLASTGVDALTASERRVAEMAAEGRTNREIAQVSFVSEKTVETQLGHAYRKLDISSRTQLSRVLSEPQ